LHLAKKLHRPDAAVATSVKPMKRTDVAARTVF
jgi:hypothetical protein